jgi:hypothetical protein
MICFQSEELLFIEMNFAFLKRVFVLFFATKKYLNVIKLQESEW